MLWTPIDFTATVYVTLAAIVGGFFGDGLPEYAAPCPVAAPYDFSHLSRNIPTRQNNPLNIVRTQHRYPGELPSAIRFERFVTPEAGFAAAFHGLRACPRGARAYGGAGTEHMGTAA